MRIVVVGTSSEAVEMMELLVGRGHELIVLDRDRDKIEALEEELEASFLHGDGTSPAILKETDPESCDVLIALMGEDQDNILACLVGRSLGFPRVVPRINAPDFEELCQELGLDEAIVPDRTVGRYLADLVEGLDVLELRTVIKGEARFFSFQAEEEDEGTIEELELPEKAAAVCYYRDGEFHLAEPSGSVREGDEVVILTHSSNLAELRDRWTPRTAPPESSVRA